MIAGPDVTLDDAGFPVVTWTEHRGAGSPAGSGSYRMLCRIGKDAATGELLFVVRGDMRNRTFEAGRPWARLTSFGYHAALHRYLTPVELAMREQLLAKTKAGKVLAGDGGKALLAEFSHDGFFDVSCPEAAGPDLDRLQLVLTREFVLERVWGWEFTGDSRTVDVHIRWLREKIETDPSDPHRIVTVRGAGYRFEG